MLEMLSIEYSQTIGNVGYVLPMLEKLQVAEIIDKYCPKRCDGDYLPDGRQVTIMAKSLI